MTEFEELPDDPFSSTGTEETAAAEPSVGDSGPLQRLFDGAAEGPGVPELQGEYGLSRPWAMVCRGTLRVATGTGVPPIFEIVAGSAMGVLSAQDGDGAAGVLPSSSSDGAQDEESGDVSAGSPPPVQ